MESNLNFNGTVSNYYRKRFIDNLAKRPDLLEHFSTDRLKIILKYCIEQNERKIELIKKLNS